VEPYATQLPFNYSADDRRGFGAHPGAPVFQTEQCSRSWAKSFIDSTPERNTLNVLIAMTPSPQARFRLRTAGEVGVQEPTETLRLKTAELPGFAVFMMEAVRSVVWPHASCQAISMMKS